MDQTTRNKLQRATQDARRLLEREFGEQLEGTFDILPDGTILPEAGAHLDSHQRLVRGKLVAAVQHRIAGCKQPAEAVDDYRREAAFTCLNRFAALKMLEARGLVQQCVSKGDESAGFKEFAGLAPGLSQLPDKGYRLYLESLLDELSIEVKVLFDRRDPASLLWPRPAALSALLAVWNDTELACVWDQDETIGWVYQYFNSQDERRAMREASQAPRNSRELAVRNQFFTPRYVVQFLTDNTLGRIWYDMRQGDTRLKEQCEYLVRRPDEVYLAPSTDPNHKHAEPGCIAMAKLLKDGNEETFSEFRAGDKAEAQRLIDLAHCVSAYDTRGDAAWQWYEEVHGAFSSGRFRDSTTQDILEFLFLTCRSDRHGGDGTVYSESWFMDAANEVRRRVLWSHQQDLPQEDVLKIPVFVPFRDKKDPRGIKILDPACGSGHFLLYCFDLLQTIYEEAWADEDLPSPVGGRAGGSESLLPLREAYPTLDRLRAAVPELILRHNLHGIDIDPRCVQIAALALWMRAQRAWQTAGIVAAARPRITTIRVVCAAPMPGEESLLQEFLNKQLSATMEDRELGKLVRRAFKAMTLAGEAGSLLKIEEEIAIAVAEAKKTALAAPQLEQRQLFDARPTPPKQKQLDFETFEITDEAFWEQAEQRLYTALRDYAEQAEREGGFQRRLFAHDAAGGFAFIDLCRQRYAVVLMNPPFGASSCTGKGLLDRCYARSKNDLYAAFIERGIEVLSRRGMVGAISSRTGFFLSTFQNWRENVLLREAPPVVFADLGYGVLDSAAVEVAAYCLEVVS